MTETSEYPAMMSRFLAAWVRRVAAADAYDLGEMAEVLGRTAAPVWDAVLLNRESEENPWPWRDVGDALGITKQAAQQQASRHAASRKGPAA